MKFHTLELKGIRRFSRKTIHFVDGLNIVYGPNESGKSTILESLLASLSKPTPDMVSSLKQWNSLSSRIKLTYETNGDQYTITRGLDPVEEYIEGKTLSLVTPEKIEEIIESHVGTADKTILENSLVVKQNEMHILQEEGARAKVRNRVRTLISGVPGRSTEKALQFLEESMDTAQTFIEEADNRIKTIENELQAYKESEEEFQDLNVRLNVYKSDLERDRNLLSGYDVLLKYRKSEKEYQKLLRKLEEIENLEGYKRRLPIREKELISDLQKELNSLSGKQDTIIAKKAEVREKLILEKKKLSAIDDELEGVQIKSESIFSKIANIFKSSRSRREELAGKRVEISQNVARLEDLLERFEEKLSELKSRFQRKGERLQRLIEECKEYENWTAEMLEDRQKKYEYKIEKILDGITKQDLKQKIEEKRKDADELRAKLVRNYPDLKDKKDTERILIEKVKLAEIISEWEEKIEGLNAKIELISTKVEQREELIKELEHLKIEKDQHIKQMNADKTANNIISAVYNELKEKFVPELEKRAETLLDRITQGRYTDIVVKKDNLDVLIHAPEKETPVDIDVLSQGTRDQLYLCLRIALSELLTGGKNPPLLFDEAFYTFDEDRLRETLQVLQEIAKTTQVIVFTHDESYAEYGHGIELKKI
ncbi:MAG: AAA family ATPase [Candidatus Methanofastidiosia archaeon]|jgi:DNA repair exonuclease SbcCD ATPase subunit